MKASHMNIMVLKTDIKTRKKVNKIRPILNHHPIIRRWTVDTQDIDNVLRIESNTELTEAVVIQLLRSIGFYGEALPD